VRNEEDPVAVEREVAEVPSEEMTLMLPEEEEEVLKATL
jgi:hypothetical protein